ncbi:MAG: glycosyltransferase family 2 protein [Undibacterium sp.]|nr:glycosyltransferase family 2 protein [Undibacterium sp.]
MMDVTIIIVNWNSGLLLNECLRHLELQTIQPQKIIVVDNLSTDDSLIDLNCAPNVTIHQMGANLGFAAANNYSIKQCNTEFVILLNPDAFPNSDWLEKLMDAAEQHPDIAAFGSRQLRDDNTEILDGIGDSYHMSGLVWRTGYGSLDSSKKHNPSEIFSPCAAAALYRTKVLQNLEGFDEDFFCYVEDVDLGFRLRLAGHKAMYVAKAMVRHVGSATTGGRGSDFSVYHGHRNLVWTYVKNMPGILFWLLLPMHILLNIVTIAVFASRGQASVILRAKRDALYGLPSAWAKRKRIQENRTAHVSDIWRVLDKQIIPKKRGI